MKNKRTVLVGLLSIALVISMVLPAAVLRTGPVMAQETVTPMVAEGAYHTVGLRVDGTVVAVGSNSDGQCDVADWTDIVHIAAGSYHTVGVKSDGTVVAAGPEGYHWVNYGQCDVGGWTDIVQVAAGYFHTVGVREDGTVVAAGYSWAWEGVDEWTDIEQVTAGSYHTVGLKEDGTVVAVGGSWTWDSVGEWTDIVQVAAGYAHTVGVKEDGTVVAVGGNEYGQCDVEDWADIVQVAAGDYHTVGVREDGTVVAAGAEGPGWPDYGQCDVGGWTDIVQVAAGQYQTVGLRSDGGVLGAPEWLLPHRWNLHYPITARRELPAVVVPGEEFEVRVTFVAPVDGFHAIGLTDRVPYGLSWWDDNVSVNATWSEPEAMEAHVEGQTVEYVWAGPYDAGTEFTAVYRVRASADAWRGFYTFGETYSGYVEYYTDPLPAPSWQEEMAGDSGVAITGVAGQTRAVNSDILSGVTINLYEGDDAITSVVSDTDGKYVMEVPGLWGYHLVASKEGFRNEVWSVGDYYTMDFVSTHGLIPNAPDTSYVLSCISVWKFGDWHYKLTMSRMLAVISAWKYPIT